MGADGVHRGSAAGDGAAAEVVAVGKPAWQHSEIGAGRQG